MGEIKVLKILRSFTDEERASFRELADSIYFRKNRKYEDLLDRLENQIRIPSSGSETRKGNFQDSIFKGTGLNNQTLRNRLNELTKLAEKFIILKELEKDHNLHRFLLLRGLREHKLVKIFDQEFAKLPDITNFRNEKSHVVSDILWLNIVMKKENRKFQEMFSGFNSHIEYIYTHFLEILFDNAKEYEIEKMYNVNIQARIFSEVINNFNAGKLIKSIEGLKDKSYRKLIINYYLYKSFADINDTESFDRLRGLFNESINELSDSLKNDIMTDLISLYFNKINRGETKYLKDVFSLYKLKLKLGLYGELKIIRYPSSAFRDYIVVGIRLKHFSWVENFIKKYSNELPEEIRDEEVSMGYARLYFSKKDYRKTLEILNGLKTENYLYVLDASNTKLRTLYETLDFEEAFLEIDRIKHYIKNNAKKISSSVRKYNIEFLDKYNKLLKIRLSPDRKELDFFRKSVHESATLVAKNWFTEKLKEL